MAIETGYFKEGGVQKRIRIEPDNEPRDPREDMDGNVGEMAIWWNRYSLGDVHDVDYPEDYLNGLVEKHVPEKKVIAFAKSGKAEKRIQLMYGRDSKQWSLWGETRTWRDGIEYMMISESCPGGKAEALIDDIIENLSFSDRWKLLEASGVVHLDLYMYEHSGLTISCSKSYPYTDRWDGGQCGYIVTTKEKVLATGGMVEGKRKGTWKKVTDRNWKEAAYAWMEGEVEVYDQYLTGEVYGYEVDELDEDGTWTETTDSCWGFYSDKCGKDLLLEIAGEATGEPISFEAPLAA